MVCATCQHDNQPNAKFCSECGAPLARPCPSCGRQQPATAKFCDECGTSLAATPSAAAEPAPKAVRKRVTALFADLVGSTSFAERLDAETVRAGLAPYFDLLKSTIDDHAGTVVKFLGDGMFALFGVPEVAEDDARRAVAAGVDLQRRFRAFAADVRGRHGVELGLRVGVNTGELVVGEDDVDIVGDVINTAARLEAACVPGHVLVGEDTWRLTRSSVRYEVLGEVPLKGKAEPIATFQVVDHDLGITDELTPFVGRSGELDTLRAVLDDARAGSGARLATVIGDPGVGKTRLAHELRAGSGARSFDLRLERRGSTTFTPIADLLREVTGSGTAEEVNRLVDGHPEAGRLGTVLASFLGHGESRTTEESFWAVRRLLELLAADGPVIVVVDDIQWAEPLFWDLLEHLVEWTAAPVLLLALARPELRELRPVLTQIGRRVSASIALEGLDPVRTLELAARILGIDELPTELADRLPESTEGNPLFVRELVQMLVDDGVLARDGDRWRLTIDADAIEVPPTILSLLASRVERLPADERQVVELASVIGTEFDRGTLGAIAGGAVATRLGEVIDRLRRKDLVEPSGQWAGDHPVYRFHHVLIRDAAYRRLLKGHRAELHERVGRHVEMSRTADDERDVIVAHHFEQVFQYRSELGALDDHTRELAFEAATCLRSAAEQALGREDLASAGSAAIRALRMLDVDAGADRDELLLTGCEALLSSGDVTRGAPLVDELHERSSDDRLAAWADCFRAQLWSLTDAERLTEASDVTAAAAERLAALDDDAGVAKARLVRAACLARLGRVGECEAELDLALGAARAAGDRRRTVAVLGAAPLAALWGPSPVARAGGRCLDVLRLLRITSASPTVEATSIRCQGMLEALRGRGEAARAKFENSRATARELGLRHGLCETELFAGFAELLAGDAVAAEPHLRAARDGLGRLGIGADAGQAAALLARSLLLQGRIADSDELASGALETAGQNLQTAMTSRAVLAEVRAAQGRHDEARALIDEALAIAAPTDATLDHALTLLAAARVAASAGDSATSRRRRALATELLAAKGITLRLDGASASGPTDDRPVPTEAPSPADAIPDPSRPRIWNHALEAAQLEHDPSALARSNQEPGTRSADGGRGLTNTTWEIGVAVDAALLRRDREGLLDRLAPEFTAVWHERLAGGGSIELARTDLVDAVFSFLDDGVLDRTTELIAVRGGELALSRETTVYDTFNQSRLLVIESHGSRLTHLEFFDDDQLDEARVQMDRRYLVSQGLPPDHWVVEHWHRAYATDWADLAPIVRDDLAYVDHRRIIGNAGGRSTLGDSMHASGPGLRTSLPRILRVSPTAIVVERLEVVDGEPGEMRNLLVLGFADDGITSLDVFDSGHPDGEIRAIARYDDLTHPLGRVAEPLTPNRAYRIADELGRVAIRRDRDGMLGLLADDFEVDHHGRAREILGALTHGNRDALVDEVLTMYRDDRAASLSRALVAIRGDSLYLSASTTTTVDGDELLTYAIGESDGPRLRSLTYFDESQAERALADLDRRYRLACGIGDDHWIARNWHTLTSTDVDEYDKVLAADFRWFDHRSVKMPVLERDEFIRVMRPLGTPTAMSLPAIHRLCDRAMVSEHVETWDADSGATHMLVVFEYDAGSTRRADSYEPGDLDAALARYDEIVAAGRPRRTRTNAAWEVVQQVMAALRDGDRERYASLFAENFEATPHDPLTRIVALDHDGRGMDKAYFVDRSFDPLLNGPTSIIESELIAVRGDDFGLVRTRITTGDGDLYERINLFEVSGGLVVRRDSYPHDQLREAQIALDHRHRRACGLGDVEWMAEAGASAFYATDFADIAPFLHPDFEYVEHRPLSFPNADADGVQAAFEAFPVDAEVIIPVVHRLSVHGMVYERLDRHPDGWTSDQLHVAQFQDGRTRRLIAYQLDDLELALAHYDAIVNAAFSAERGSGLTNEAVEVHRAFGRAFDAGDHGRLDSLLADDFVAFTSDWVTRSVAEGRMTRSSFVENVMILRDVADAETTTRVVPVAIRGDHFALVHTTVASKTGDAVDRFNVIESRDGRLARMHLFTVEQLREAFAELDRGWLATLDLNGEEWIARHWDLSYSMHFHEVAGALHRDFEFVDHRPLHFPSGGVATLDATMGTLDHEVDVLVPQVHRLSPKGAVIERIERAVGDVLGEEHMIMVSHIVDDSIRRIDVYTVEDLAAALARYEEITHPSAPRLDNDAAAITRAGLLAHRDGDRERFAALLAEEFVAAAHDPLMSNLGRLDRVRYVDAAFDPSLYGPSSTMEYELIAVRGDDLCLFSLRTTTTDGDVVERLHLIEAKDSLVVGLDAYSRDQLREAQIELDRRWLVTIGLGESWLSELIPVIYDPRGDVLFEFLGSDFEFIDHRPMMFGRGDAAQLRSIVDTMHDMVLTVPRIHRLSDAGSVFERIETAVDEIAEFHFVFVSRYADQMVRSVEAFDITELDRALARYDEFFEG